MTDLLKQVKFDEKGLIPAVLQDINNNEVLMVAYMDREALEKTIETGKAWFWSRSREKLWLKGESSANYQLVEEIRLDCDSDTLLVKVRPMGPACHTGHQSCFYREFNDRGEITEIDRQQEKFLEKAAFLKELYNIIQDRKENPQPDSYTNYLLREGVDKVSKKIGEEAAEVIIGAKNESRREIIYEVADLIYHLLVLLVIYNISLEDLLAELKERNN